MRLLLLHPPLLSPVVLSRLAPVLRADGHDVAVPDLREAITTGPVGTWWARAVDVAAAAMPEADVVVALSGAGALVPPLVRQLPTATTVVLIDAVLPPMEGTHSTSPRVSALVADLATEGMLPAWTSWWPPAELIAQVPDDRDRAALISSTPCLSEAFYDVDVPAPAGWEPASRSYLRLSSAYAAEAHDAADRGWSVEARDGNHLDVLASAGVVAAAVERLLAI